MKKLVIFSVVLLFAGFLIVLKYVPPSKQVSPFTISGEHPSPTEYLQMKKAKKEFKKNRNEWIEDMHKSAPGTDWKEVDLQTRQEKNNRKSALRKNLIGSGKLWAKDKYPETFNNRDLIGYWEEKGSNNLSGRMLTTDYDAANNVVYGASQGNNIWVGDLDGNWANSINDYIKINNIQMVQAVPNGNQTRLIVVQDYPAKVYYTDDNGISWNTSSGISSSGNLRRGIIVNDGNHTIYVIRESSGTCFIYRSTDLGETFSQIANFNVSAGKMDLWSPKYGSPDVYFLNKNTLFKLENDNFIQVAAFNLDFPLTSISKTILTGCETQSSLYLYAMYRANDIAYFYQSPNNGLNWQYKSQISGDYLIPFTKNSFTCSTLDPQKIYVGGMECFRSFDGGSNWTKLNEWWEYYDNMNLMLHADIPGIEMFRIGDNFEFALISTDAGTYLSYDDLLSVQNISLNGLRISQYYSTYTHRDNPDIVFAGSQDQGFQRTLNAGAGLMDLTQIISGDYGHIVSGDYGNSVWTVYPGFAIYYPNATENENSSVWNFSGSNYLWMPPLMEDPVNPQNVYVAGGGSSGDAHLWHLLYQNGNISAVEESFNFAEGYPGTKVSAMAYSPLNHDLRYVLTTDGRFFNSQNEGENWETTPAFEGPHSHFFYGSSIVASLTNSEEIYIAGSGYNNPAVYISQDGGHSFSAMDTGLPNTLVYELAASETYVFAATEVGPYAFEIDGSGEWFDLAGVSGPDQVYWSVDYIPSVSTARFGTYGRGIWDFVIEEETSASEDVTDDEHSTLPLSNYPNPFKTSTVISFAPQNSTEISEINIYNVKGQKVRKLSIPKRQSSVIWNGKDEEGNNVSSGMYLAKLDFGNKIVTRKIILKK